MFEEDDRMTTNEENVNEQNNQSLTDVTEEIIEEVDIEELIEEDTIEIEIESPNHNPNRWKNLSKNSLRGESYIFEFCDNSIAHHQPGVPLKIVIDVFERNRDLQRSCAQKIVITDNAKGIPPDFMGKALTPDFLSDFHPDEIGSEHGYGMKFALASSCNEPKITTRVMGEMPYVIDSEKIIEIVNGGNAFGRELGDDIEFNGAKHGTKIELSELTPQGEMIGELKGKLNHLRDLSLRLGQRYRLKLTDENIFGAYSQREDAITINRYDESGELVQKYNVEGIGPLYVKDTFSGVARQSIGGNHQLQDESESPNWKAMVRVGIAPKSNEDWDILNVSSERQREYDPYRVTKQNAGFDIIHRGIVIKYGWLPKPTEVQGIVNHGSVNNKIRGEIELIYGFQSTREKVGMHADKNWMELMAKLEDLLFRYEHNGEVINLYQDHLVWKGKANQNLTEESYVNQFKNMLREEFKHEKTPILAGFPNTTSFTQKGEITTEFGNPDIVINQGMGFSEEIIVEAKAEKISAEHVYQLRKYLDARNTKFGIMYGPEMLQSGTSALAYLNGISTISDGKKRKTSLFSNRRYYIRYIPTTRCAAYSKDFE